jgi:hypothetical protein
MPHTDKQEPMLAAAMTDKEGPQRAMLRREIEEPTLTEENTDIVAPSRMWFLSATGIVKCAKSSIDTDAPKWTYA